MMEQQIVDTTGLAYPSVLFQIAIKAVEMHRGDVLQVVGDCPTFEKIVRDWCKRLRKNCLAVRKDAENRMTVWIGL